MLLISFLSKDGTGILYDVLYACLFFMGSEACTYSCWYEQHVVFKFPNSRL